MAELAGCDGAESGGEAGDLGGVSGEGGERGGGGEAGGDDLAELGVDVLRLGEALGGEGEADAGFVEVARGADPFFPFGGAILEDLQGVFAFEGVALAIVGFGGDDGFVGEVDAEDDGDVEGFEARGDLGGFATAEDDAGGAEFLGEVEGAVDLVLGIGFPPDREGFGAGGVEGDKGGVEGRASGAVLWLGREEVVMVGVDHGLAEVGDGAHEGGGVFLDTGSAIGAWGGVVVVRMSGFGGGAEADVEGDRGEEEGLAPRDRAEADQGALAGGDRS